MPRPGEQRVCERLAFRVDVEPRSTRAAPEVERPTETTDVGCGFVDHDVDAATDEVVRGREAGRSGPARPATRGGPSCLAASRRTSRSDVPHPVSGCRRNVPGARLRTPSAFAASRVRSVPSPYLSGAHCHRGGDEWDGVGVGAIVRRGEQDVTRWCSSRARPGSSDGTGCAAARRRHDGARCRRLLRCPNRCGHTRVRSTAATCSISGFTISPVSPRWCTSPLARAFPLSFANRATTSLGTSWSIGTCSRPRRARWSPGCSLRARARCTAWYPVGEPITEAAGFAPVLAVRGQQGRARAPRRRVRVAGLGDHRAPPLQRLRTRRRARCRRAALHRRDPRDRRTDHRGRRRAAPGLHVRRRHSRHARADGGSRTTAAVCVERRFGYFTLDSRRRPDRARARGRRAGAHRTREPQSAPTSWRARSCSHRSSSTAADPLPWAWRRVGRRTRRVRCVRRVSTCAPHRSMCGSSSTTSRAYAFQYPNRACALCRTWRRRAARALRRHPDPEGPVGVPLRRPGRVRRARFSGAAREFPKYQLGRRVVGHQTRYVRRSPRHCAKSARTSYCCRTIRRPPGCCRYNSLPARRYPRGAVAPGSLRTRAVVAVPTATRPAR